MERLKGIIILLSVIIFAGCSEDELVLPKTFVELDPNVFGFDYNNEIILYNGESTAINNGELIIGDDTFNIETTDKEFSFFKEYSVVYK